MISAWIPVRMKKYLDIEQYSNIYRPDGFYSKRSNIFLHQITLYLLKRIILVIYTICNHIIPFYSRAKRILMTERVSILNIVGTVQCEILTYKTKQIVKFYLCSPKENKISN